MPSSSSDRRNQSCTLCVPMVSSVASIVAPRRGLAGQIGRDVCGHADRDGEDDLVEVPTPFEHDVVGVWPRAPVRLERRLADTFRGVELIGERPGGKAVEAAEALERLVLVEARTQPDLTTEVNPVHRRHRPPRRRHRRRGGRTRSEHRVAAAPRYSGAMTASPMPAVIFQNSEPR